MTEETVKVEFSDGSVWSVPLDTIRQHRANIMLAWKTEESNSHHYWYVDTLKLFEAVKGKLEILQYRYELKGGRDDFSITVVPKK